MLIKQKIYKKGSLLLVYLGGVKRTQMVFLSEQLANMEKHLIKENIGYGDHQFEKVLYTDIDLITPRLFAAYIMECDKKELVIEQLKKSIAGKTVAKHVRFKTREKQFLIPKPKQKEAATRLTL